MLEHLAKTRQVFPLEFRFDEENSRWYAEQVIEHIKVRFVLDWSIPERGHWKMPTVGQENFFESEVTRILYSNERKRYCLIGVKIIGPVVV